MTIEKHDLHHELPEFEQEIHQLKINNAHFVRLFKEYHDKDQLFTMLNQAQAVA